VKTTIWFLLPVHAVYLVAAIKEVREVQVREVRLKMLFLLLQVL
jgi:hypothetical protein